MGLSLYDLTHDLKRTVTVTFETGATLNVTYLPSALNAVNERQRIITMASEAFGGEADALASYISKLVESWDLVFDADPERDPFQPVQGIATLPDDERRVTVTHGLGFKPKLSQIRLRGTAGELPAKGHVDKLNAETFDLHIPEDEKLDDRRFIWEAVDLGGLAVPPSLRNMRFLGLDIMKAINQAIHEDISPNRRRAAS